MKTTRLFVWMNGLPVGYWEHHRGRDLLHYFPEWRGDALGRPLSLSLPFTPGNQPLQGGAVSAYFDNLLPDSERIRVRLAARYRAPGIEPFALLGALGRDCVGAIQLLPDDQAPQDLQRIRGRPLSEAQVARLLRETVSDRSLGQDEQDGLRFSIAGAQEKTALLRHRGRWMLPEGSTPTTHLFKLPLGLVGGLQLDLRHSVENEWLCGRILHAFGLPVAASEMGWFEDQRVLIVERFDRRPATDGSWIVRLPQEDMCQATATPPHLKYQRDGGPGPLRILDILSGAEDPVQARAQFFAAQLVFWLLAATDGHAKNFSITHLPGNTFRPTPLYDVLSAHPLIGRGRGKLPLQKAKMAMGLCGTSGWHYAPSQLSRRRLDLTAARAAMPRGFSAALVEQLLSSLEAVCETVQNELPADFPGEVVEPILRGMRTQAERLGPSAATA